MNPTFKGMLFSASEPIKILALLRLFKIGSGLDVLGCGFVK